MERAKPAPFSLAATIRISVLMTGDAENLAIGQGVRSTGGNCNLMVCFPAAKSVVIATGVPVKHLAASPRSMSATASSTFTSSARALPGCEDGYIRKSHISLSFPQRKLTKPGCGGIITMHTSAPSKPLVLLTAVVSAS